MAENNHNPFSAFLFLPHGPECFQFGMKNSPSKFQLDRGKCLEIKSAARMEQAEIANSAKVYNLRLHALRMGITNTGWKRATISKLYFSSKFQDTCSHST